MNINKTTLILHHLLQNDLFNATTDLNSLDIEEKALDLAWEELNYFTHQRIFPLNFEETDFPKSLLRLSNAPKLLYGMGKAECLSATEIVAYLAEPPLQEAPFEAAQQHLKVALLAKKMICAGTFSGFDTVIHKICSEAKKPSIMINPCGLAHAKYSFRPQAVASLNTGGYMFSVAKMFGKYTDESYLASLYIQAAIATEIVYICPKETSPLNEVLDWAKENGKLLTEM